MRKLAFIGSHLRRIDEKAFLLSVTFCDRLSPIQFLAETKRAYFLNSKKAGSKKKRRHMACGIERGILIDFKCIHITTGPSKGQPKGVEFCNYTYTFRNMHRVSI